jgi:hypothetical protein
MEASVEQLAVEVVGLEGLREAMVVIESSASVAGLVRVTLYGGFVKGLCSGSITVNENVFCN